MCSIRLPILFCLWPFLTKFAISKEFAVFLSDDLEALCWIHYIDKPIHTYDFIHPLSEVV